MAHNSSLVNLTSGYSKTTTNPNNSEICSGAGGVQSSVPHIVNAALNVLLAITTTLANLLVFLAMRRSSSIRLPSKLLLCTLVLTDLGTGLVVQPQYAAFLLMEASHHNYRLNSSFLLKSFRFTAGLFCGVSLLTLTAISLDRYTALFFHLKYQVIVTIRRVCAALTLIWSFSLFFGTSLLWNEFGLLPFSMTAIPICFFVISVTYIKIYRRLRSHHDPQVQPQALEEAQQQAGSRLNIEKYKRTASTMLWIYALFILCFVPYFCVVSITTAFEYTSLSWCLFEFSVTFVLLNSCLNPFVYCLRLPEIRAEVLKQLYEVCCQSPQQ